MSDREVSPSLVRPEVQFLSVRRNDAMRKSASMDFDLSLPLGSIKSRSSSNSPNSPRRKSDHEISRFGRFHSTEKMDGLVVVAEQSSRTMPSKFRKSHSTSSAQNHLAVIDKKQFKRISKKTKDINNPLHYPKTIESLLEFLSSGYDPDSSVNEEGLFPLHTYITRQRKKKYVDLLYTLLTNSEASIDLPTSRGKLALHMAVEERNLHIIKLLLVFGADVNKKDSSYRTPLDVALESNFTDAITLIQSLGGVQGDLARNYNFDAALPRLKSFHDSVDVKERLRQRRKGTFFKPCNGDQLVPISNANKRDMDSSVQYGGEPNNQVTDQRIEDEPDGMDQDHAGVAENNSVVKHHSVRFSDSTRNDDLDEDECVEGAEKRERIFSQSLSRVTLKDMEDGHTLSTLYERLQQCININLEISGSFSINTDEAIAITMQQKELLKYKRTGQERMPMFNVKEGSRILFLDGGGMRGLLQIEILEQLEKKTHRKITELFDWIIGTSTGGIVALGLVYANRTLAQLRQLYFKIKDKVFGSDRWGFGYNTEVFEQLLQQEFGTSMRLSDVQFPKVIITAVYKKTTMPELHFFNNCFHDEFSNQLVWKVARYTSAAPLFFREFEDYVDGGVLANNPCSYGLSAIQNFHRQAGQKLNIAFVVSVGSGIFPTEDLGKTDAQQFLYFGKHWLKAGHDIKARAKSLMTLLTTALVESESVAKSFNSRLQEQGIPFYRFNPPLNEVIPSGETDLTKLLNMCLKTKKYIITQGDRDHSLSQLDELVKLFHLVADLNRKRSGRE